MMPKKHSTIIPDDSTKSVDKAVQSEFEDRRWSSFLAKDVSGTASHVPLDVFNVKGNYITSVVAYEEHDWDTFCEAKEKLRRCHDYFNRFGQRNFEFYSSRDSDSNIFVTRILPTELPSRSQVYDI